MCVRCNFDGIECDYPGNDCCFDEDSYLPPEEADLIINPPAYESKMSMSDKVEVEVEKDVDKNGIITKQSEVYVWNDQVFASYKAALAASKKSKIVEVAVKHMYPTYSAAQIKSTIKVWENNPHGYYIYVDKLVPIVSELLAE